jgi:hypothetical protein
MPPLYRRRWAQVLAVVVLVPLIAVVGFGIYLASLAGDLPWQTDPTRVAVGITPFADIPGFTAPTQAPALDAAAATSSPTPTPSR